MAESSEAYHVPQQSRRDKLRLSNLQTMLPIYDPDFLTLVKEEACNFMGYNPSFSTTNLMYIDPSSTSFQDVEATPFLYNSRSVRLLDHSFYGGQVINSCGQGLSLSLSGNPQNYEHDSSIYGDKVGSLVNGVGRNEVYIDNDLSRRSVPLGPFTGYASVLKRSRFLRPAQQLLEEICDVGRGIYAAKMSDDEILLEPLMENVGDDSESCNLGSEQRKKKSRLMSMLDEVYKRYKQYYQQMQAVVASFESVAGVANAAPFACMAFKTMSKHFRRLRKAISDQLHFLTKPHIHDMCHEKDMAPGFESSSGTGILGFVQHQPVWRPQRGLPERAVAVLRAWLFDHFLHPYPTDTDKLMLAKQTGLSRNQVSNWFINARVRLWKPMVEEIHTLETRQAQKPTRKEVVHATDGENDHLIPTTSSSIPISSDKTSDSKQGIQEISLKRTRKESVADNETQRNYDNISNVNHHLGFGVSSGGASGSVSLTLGLQQNNGNTRILDPFPFGLSEPNGEGYVAGWLP